MFPTMPGRMEVATSTKLDTLVLNIGPYQQTRVNDLSNEAWWKTELYFGAGEAGKFYHRSTWILAMQTTEIT